MKISQFRALTAIVDNDLKISRAADCLHTVQSAISRQIGLFEEEIGTPLFQRHGKRLVALTAAGKEILGETRSILESVHNLQLISEKWSAPGYGRLRIVTTHTQAKYFLPNVITELRQRYPKLHLHIKQGSPDELIHMLHRDHADIAICTEKVGETEGLRTEICYHWHHALIVPKKHPLAEIKELTLNALVKYPIITYVFGFTGRGMLQSAFEAAGLQPQIVLAAADTDIIKTYVRSELGVGVIAAMGWNPGNDKDLVSLSLAHLVPASAARVAWRKNAYLPKSTKDTIELLQAEGKKMQC